MRTYLTNGFVDYQVVTKTLGRLTHRAAAVALDTWRDHAARQRRVTKVASKGVLRMLSRSLTLALARWREAVGELRRLRQVKFFCHINTSNANLYSIIKRFIEKPNVMRVGSRSQTCYA